MVIRRHVWCACTLFVLSFATPVTAIEHFIGLGNYHGFLAPKSDDLPLSNQGYRMSISGEYEFAKKFRKTWLFYSDYNLNSYLNPNLHYASSLFSIGAKYIRDFVSLRLNFRDKVTDPIMYLFPFLFVFEYASYFAQILVPIHPFAAEGAIIEFNNSQANLGYFLAAGLTTGNIDITLRFNHLFYNTFDTGQLVHNLQFLIGISFHGGLGVPAVEWENTW